ncbi:MAG TPA: FMN-binding protein [Firmicutes bacterium]|nr:FMN-binding protein [Bacillota bacterium]
MRDLLRLVLTMTIVGIVSAVVLTAANAVTEPVIIQRQEEEYRQTLEEYFPDLAEFKTREIEGARYDEILNRQQEMLGVMATAQAQGYDGNITYNLAVDKEGQIIGIKIVSHTETEGIGSVIEQPEFQNRMLRKGFQDPIQPGVDVDTVSGATISSTAMINSVRETMEVIGSNFYGVKKKMVDLSAVPGGTYRGSAQGYQSEVVVEVTVDQEKITEIEVLKHGDTPTYFAESFDLVRQQIIDLQRLEAVDIKTGATGSADGIVKAVFNALQGATNGGGGEEE